MKYEKFSTSYLKIRQKVIIRLKRTERYDPDSKIPIIRNKCYYVLCELLRAHFGATWIAVFLGMPELCQDFPLKLVIYWHSQHDDLNSFGVGVGYLT